MLVMTQIRTPTKVLGKSLSIGQVQKPIFNADQLATLRAALERFDGALDLNWPLYRALQIAKES